MKVINEDISYQGKVFFLNLPSISTDVLLNSTTPSVLNRNVLRGSGSVVTVTNFLNGTDGQSISIVGDGTTTVKNNTNIVTNTGADILLTANLVYRFTYLIATDKWHMDK